VRVPVLTAVTDARWEAGIVGAFENGAHGVAVVRRCVDLADLLATAAAGTARAVLLSADLRRLDREALARLAVAGVAVVGIGEATAFARLGVRYTAAADAAPEAVANAVLDAVAAAAIPPRAEPEPEPLVGEGRVVAVWGPTGAPGRTTVAVTLATELAALGRTTTLVDADVYGGAVAQSLGLLDEAPGLAAAVRLATNGLLDLAALAEVARALGPDLRVLTGITRAERWPELRPTGVETVLALCRALTAFTVVDCGFALEQDEELSYDQAAHRRNGATLAALHHADTVIAVGSADPVSLQRLVRALGDLPATPEVVVNRVRNGVMPGNPETEIAAALERYAGVTPAAFLPYDRAATDAATMRGLSLAEAAPGSPLRLALRAYAARLAGVPAEPPKRRLVRR
jgi:MinD-like ATPase involved in chromosome partitioning or flagellar assembly